MARLHLGRELLTVSGLTLLSRLLGLGRDIVIAILFPVGVATDAFFIAFKLPNMFRRLTAEGAFTQAFVPVFNKVRRLEGEDAAAILRDRIAVWLALFLFVLTIVGIIAAPILVRIIAPGFAAEPAKIATASQLLRITFPYIMLISLTAFGGAIMNSYGRFASFAFAPALLNIVMIGVAILLAPSLAEPVEALAWGVIIGGGAQLLWQGTMLARAGQLPRLSWPRASRNVRRVFKLTMQGALGVSVAQLNIAISLVFASFLVEGSVSWLYFADRLMELPSGMLGAALASIALPTLARQAAAADQSSYSATLDWGLRVAVLTALPAACGLAVLAVPICATLFQHGAFSATDAIQTARAALAYSLGVPALVALRLLAGSFNARLEVLIPIKVSAFALGATIFMYVFLTPVLQHAGLALATSLGATINMAILLALLLRKGYYRPNWRWWLPALVRMLTAALAMSGLLVLLRGDAQAWLEASWSWRAVRLALLIIGGASTYFALLFVWGLRWTDLQPPRETLNSQQPAP